MNFVESPSVLQFVEVFEPQAQENASWGGTSQSLPCFRKVRLGTELHPVWGVMVVQDVFHVGESTINKTGGIGNLNVHTLRWIP